MLARIPYPALASLTSGTGTARNGTALTSEFANPGQVIVVCSASITTASVLATFKLQGSVDGTTYVDISGATFATAAGTGTEVVTTKSLSFDVASIAFQFLRVVATLSGAGTGIADVTSATMYYVPAGKTA